MAIVAPERQSTNYQVTSPWRRHPPTHDLDLLASWPALLYNSAQAWAEKEMYTHTHTRAICVLCKHSATFSFHLQLLHKWSVRRLPLLLSERSRKLERSNALRSSLRCVERTPVLALGKGERDATRSHSQILGRDFIAVVPSPSS